MINSLCGDARRIVLVAAPLYLSMVVVSASALVNSAVLGRFDTAALAAFAVSVAVHSPATAAVTGAVRGVMPFISAAGEDPAEIATVLRNGSWLALVLGVLGGTAVCSVPVIARWSSVPVETINHLGVLPVLLAGALLANSFGSMATSTLVAVGASRPVLHAGLIGAVCSAVLVLVLVPGRGPWSGLGLTGSGLALFGSQVLIMVLVARALRRHTGVRLTDVVGRPVQVRQVVTLARVGIPMAGTVLIKFSVLGLLALAAARVSTSAAAVHSIAISIVGFTFTAAVAVGQATIRLISEPGSAGRPERRIRAMRAGLLVAVAALGAVGGPVVLFRGRVAGWFSQDPVVLALLSALLPLVVVSILLDGVQAVLGFGLTALKRTAPSLITFAVTYGALACACIPIGRLFGLPGLWATLVAANAVVAVGQGVAFARTVRRERSYAEQS